MRKEFREKWQKPRGQKDEVFTGHTTNYYIDGVPKSQTAYKNEINRIIDEKRFKVLTNPLYFNEKLNDAERRSILIDIIGGVDQDAIIEVPPFETKGNVTPVNGSMSVHPKMLSIVWNTIMEVAPQAPMV